MWVLRFLSQLRKERKEVGDITNLTASKLTTYFKQNIANYNSMQNLASFSNIIDRWLRYRFQTIVFVCFLVWTLLLIIETVQIQHSCHPMIHWSGTLPTECRPKPLQFNSGSSKKPEIQHDRSQKEQQITKSDRTPSPKLSSNPLPQIPNIPRSPQSANKYHSDITGGVIGIGVASLVAIVGGVPLAAAVGIGAAVWFVIRTVL